MELKEAVTQIRAAGHKLTPQRMEILRVLIAAGAPIAALAVLARVKETYPYISLDTIYRNLSMLSNTGLVNQINLQNKGTALFEFQGEAHHHHAICLECGKSFCVDACPPGGIALSERLNHYGYRTATYKGSGCSGCGICFLVCPEPGARSKFTERRNWRHGE